MPPPDESYKHKRGTLRLDEMFETALKYRNLSNTHRKLFARFVREVGKNFADEISPKIALDYLTERYGSGNGKSFNNVRIVLNTVFKLCLIEAGIECSPFEKVMPRRVETVIHHRPLTQEEFLKAFHAAEEPWKTLSLIAWHTGARLETCKRIMEELLTSPADEIIIKPGKTARFGRSVYIPIHPELRAWIDHVIASEVDWHSWQVKQLDSKLHVSPYVCLLRLLNILDTDEGKFSFPALFIHYTL